MAQITKTKSATQTWVLEINKHLEVNLLKIKSKVTSTGHTPKLELKQVQR